MISGGGPNITVRRDVRKDSERPAPRPMSLGWQLSAVYQLLQGPASQQPFIHLREEAGLRAPDNGFWQLWAGREREPSLAGSPAGSH